MVRFLNLLFTPSRFILKSPEYTHSVFFGILSTSSFMPFFCYVSPQGLGFIYNFYLQQEKQSVVKEAHV